MKNKKLVIEQREKIILGLEMTYKKLIEFKKSKNSPLIISKDGKIVEINPDKAFPAVFYKKS